MKTLLSGYYNSSSSWHGVSHLNSLADEAGILYATLLCWQSPIPHLWQMSALSIMGQPKCFFHLLQGGLTHCSKDEPNSGN